MARRSGVSTKALTRMPPPTEIGYVQGVPDALGVPSYAPGTLSDAKASAVYTDGEQRMRELDERLTREGVSVEDRARTAVRAARLASRVDTRPDEQPGRRGVPRGLRNPSHL